MKNSLKALLLASALALSAVFSCGCESRIEGEGQGTESLLPSSAPKENNSLWDSAEYTEDTELGEGAVTIRAEVKAEDKSVTFTVHTDSETLGAALLENDLISGDEGEFGLYIKFVNGIEADYDKDGTYWSLSRNGEYLMTGADSTPITDGEHYELTRTAG